MNKITTTFCALLATMMVQATMPANYYASLEGTSGDQILSTLYSIISDHTDVGYSGLYNVYPTSDVIPGTNKVWDMYSTCDFTHGSKKCGGSYSDVCDCYNREHSIPQSWFDEKSPMKSDAFHVIPTDGKVNGQRSNYPLGECANGTYLTSKATGRCGTSTFAGYSGTVFEVADEYKGDFARAYFYMVACYLHTSFTSSGGNKVFTYSSSTTGLTTYAVNLFLKWHRQDSVSQKELDRNEAIYAKQHNRNPFIDYPCLAEYIWGTSKGQSVSLSALSRCSCDTVIPTPKPDTTVVDTTFHILPVTNIHATSATLNWTTANTSNYTVDVFQLSENGEEETLQYCDTAGANASCSGYTNSSEVDDQVRLGSGNEKGMLTYSNLPFSAPTRVVVQARYYKTDKSAQLKLSVGSIDSTFALTNELQSLELSVPAQSSHPDLVIQTIAKGERAYVSTVSLFTGGIHVDTAHVSGYPQSVGNTLSHIVEGLEPMEEYTYTVTPQGYATSGQGVFVTEEGWTGTGFVTFPTLDWRVTPQGIALYGIPQPATITIYDARGQLFIHTLMVSDQAQFDITPGLYLVQVQCGNQQQVIKLIIR